MLVIENFERSQDAEFHASAGPLLAQTYPPAFRCANGRSPRCYRVSKRPLASSAGTVRRSDRTRQSETKGRSRNDPPTPPHHRHNRASGRAHRKPSRPPPGPTQHRSQRPKRRSPPNSRIERAVQPNPDEQTVKGTTAVLGGVLRRSRELRIGQPAFLDAGWIRRDAPHDPRPRSVALASNSNGSLNVATATPASPVPCGDVCSAGYPGSARPPQWCAPSFPGGGFDLGRRRDRSRRNDRPDADRDRRRARNDQPPRPPRAPGTGKREQLSGATAERTRWAPRT